MSKIVVVLTCFNRREKTINCLNNLNNGNNDNEYTFIVVDDKSSDGTKNAILELNMDNVVLVDGTGSLYWNGGMHKGLELVFKEYADYDYCLLVNDDVDFFDGAIDNMISYQKEVLYKEYNSYDCVVVGATKDYNDIFSYGGIKYTKGIKYEMIGPDKVNESLDTFNANCTLIPMAVLRSVGNIDPYYLHSLGDFDLGLRISKKHIPIRMYKEYVGKCNDNPKKGTWMDPSLGVRKRIKLKESFKGLPFKDWFHYLNKHFGFGTAIVRSITPYIKIFLHK